MTFYYTRETMNQLHIKLDENSSAMQWANSQTDKLGARGHIGTHLDCYTILRKRMNMR